MESIKFQLLGLFTMLLIFAGCSRDDGDIITTKTILKGRVYDVQRDRNIEGFILTFGRASGCSGNCYLAGINVDVRDTLITDENGEY